VLTHEHAVDAEVFAADKGNQSRWSHEGYAERQRWTREDVLNGQKGQITGKVNVRTMSKGPCGPAVATF